MFFRFVFSFSFVLTESKCYTNNTSHGRKKINFQTKIEIPGIHRLVTYRGYLVAILLDFLHAFFYRSGVICDILLCSLFLFT